MEGMFKKGTDKIKMRTKYSADTSNVRALAG